MAVHAIANKAKAGSRQSGEEKKKEVKSEVPASGVLRHRWKTKVGVFHNFLSAEHTLSKFGEEIYLIYLNCHTQFGSHVTNYGIIISKKGLKMYCQNTISFPLDVKLNMV